MDVRLVGAKCQNCGRQSPAFEGKPYPVIITDSMALAINPTEQERQKRNCKQCGTYSGWLLELEPVED